MEPRKPRGRGRLEDDMSPVNHVESVFGEFRRPLLDIIDSICKNDRSAALAHANNLLKQMFEV